MKRLTTLLFALLTLIGCASSADSLSAKNSSLEAEIECKDGALSLSLAEGKLPLLSPSPISLNINGEPTTWSLAKSSKSTTKESISLPYGEFSQVEVDYTQILYKGTLSTSLSSYDATLTVRLFPRSLAYRIEIAALPENSIIEETSRWIPANLNGECYSTNGEHESLGPLTISEARKSHKAPFIYRDAEHLMAFNECDLFDYPQLAIQGAEDGSALNIISGKATLSGDVALPWRVVMVGDNYADLHNQKPIYQVLSREAEGDFSWVRPGVSTWDWRVKGTTFNGLTYDMDTPSQKRFVDFCSRSNIDYLLIDAEWYDDKNPIVPVEGFDIRELVRYGKERGVGIILYYDLNYIKRTGQPALDFEHVAATYADFGVAGIKYGFLSAKPQRKTQMTHEIITTAAKYKLLVDFHDAPIPFSGMERTYPNYITREYCHAQLDRRSAFNPRQAVKMACINLLAGHMDQTNGTFALNEMASRAKGPRNEYNSTVAAEVARFVFTHTGSLSVLIDAPEAYEAKADLFEAIKRVPKKWDETRYLEMDFMSHVSAIKRSGDVWYAVAVYGEDSADHELKLDFLTAGEKYIATIFCDAEDTNFKTNKEAYKVEKREVTATDTLTIKVTEGSGFTVIFDKQ